MSRILKLLLVVSTLGIVFADELFDSLDDKHIHAVAFRLQDEKEKRLLIENDLKIVMLKLGQLERSVAMLQKKTASSHSTAYTCYRYSEVDQELRSAGRSEQELCERVHHRVFTRGDNTNYPGCGTCWCCAEVNPCPRDWKRHVSGCYFFSQSSATWLEASRTCKDKGGQLAELNTEDEKEFVEAGAKLNQGQHWVGGTDGFSEGEWIWISSMETISDSLLKWNGGQPDNAGRNEHCLEINHVDKDWNDRPCTYNNKYVCEMKIGS